MINSPISNYESTSVLIISSPHLEWLSHTTHKVTSHHVGLTNMAPGTMSAEDGKDERVKCALCSDPLNLVLFQAHEKYVVVKTVTD